MVSETFVYELSSMPCGMVPKWYTICPTWAVGVIGPVWGRILMRRRILAVLASLAFLVAACGDDDDGGGEGAEGDGETRDVVIALEAEPRTLDPQITQDGQMRRVAE